MLEEPIIIDNEIEKHACLYGHPPIHPDYMYPTIFEKLGFKRQVQKDEPCTTNDKWLEKGIDKLRWSSQEAVRLVKVAQSRSKSMLDDLERIMTAMQKRNKDHRRDMDVLRTKGYEPALQLLMNTKKMLNETGDMTGFGKKEKSPLWNFGSQDENLGMQIKPKDNSIRAVVLAAKNALDFANRSMEEPPDLTTDEATAMTTKRVRGAVYRSVIIIVGTRESKCKYLD